MNQPESNNHLPVSKSRYVSIAAGTTPKIIMALMRIILRRNNNSEAASDCQALIFDSQTVGLYDNSLLADCHIDVNELFDPDEYIPAQFPSDQQSLDRAEQEGKTVLMPADWYRNPAFAMDNQGASADPRIGATLAIINSQRLESAVSKCIGSCLDHNRNDEALRSGGKTDDRNGRLIFQIFATAPGGMSNGALSRICTIAQQQAQQFGIRAKRVVHILLRGDLPVVDVARADINQSNLLKYLRAIASGQYVDAITGKIKDKGFDMLFLQTNQNRKGRISLLDELIAHESHCQRLLWSSQLSDCISQRLTDMEHQRFDGKGDPMCGFTMSVSILDWDKNKVMDYFNNKAASMLAEAIDNRRSGSESKNEALKLANMHGVIESEEDNRLTCVLLNPAGMDGRGLIERMRQNFAERIENSTGLQKAQQLEDTINIINGTELTDFYEPLMKEQAAAVYKNASEQLNSYIHQMLSSHMDASQLKAGRFDVLSVIKGYRQLLDATKRVITDKLTQIDQLGQPHQEIINAACRQLDSLTNGSFLRRLLHPFLPGEIARCLEDSGKTFLEFRLQASACRIAVVQLLDPLIDFVDSRLAQLSMLRQHLSQVVASCRQRSERTAQRNSIVDKPLGFNIVDKAYLEEVFEHIVSQNSNKDTMIEVLASGLITEYGSIGKLLSKDADQIRHMLYRVCSRCIEPFIDETDVFNEFTKRFTTRRRRLALLRELIDQSEGRVLTVGEPQEQIVWLKIATVPDQRYQQSLQQLLEKADAKPGKWQVVVDKDIDKMSFVQIRGGISLTPQIARCHSSGNYSRRQMVERSIAPEATLIPEPGCSIGQLKVVMAKAIITDILVYEPADGFKLSVSEEKTTTIGAKNTDVVSYFRSNWPSIVRIESCFFRKLVIDEKTVKKRIQQLYSEPDSTNNQDIRLRLIDKPCLDKLTEQIRLLLPKAQRLRGLLKKDDQI